MFLTYDQIYLFIGMVMGISISVTMLHLQYYIHRTPSAFGNFILILLATFLWPLFVLFLAFARPIPKNRV